MTDSITAMRAGGHFTLVAQSPISTSVELREVFVWYERDEWKLGSFYWCDAGSDGRTKRLAQSLQLHSINDVFLSKQAAELKEPAVSEYDPAQCFSLVGRLQALHLIAPSEAVRTTWMRGLKELFRLGPAKQAGLPLGTRSNSRPIWPSASIAAITAGAAMTSVHVVRPSHLSVEDMTTASPSSAPLTLVHSTVFLWYEPRDDTSMGSLYWCDVGSRTRLPHQRIPLHEVAHISRAITLGRLEEWEQLPSFAAGCHFSLISRERSLHLIAPSATVRVTWLAELMGRLLRPFKRMQATEPVSGMLKASQHAVSPPLSRTVINSLWRMEFLVTLIHDEGSAISEAWMFHSDQQGQLGTVHWMERGEKKATHIASLPISLIADVMVSNSHERLQREDARSQYPRRRCLSLIQKCGHQLHVIFSSDECRTQWLQALREVLEGRKRVEDVLVLPPQPSRFNSSVVHILGDPHAGLRCMLLLLGSEQGALQLVDLRWSSEGVSAATASGALFWSVVGSRADGAQQGSVVLNALRAVATDKQHERMQQPDSVRYPVDQCLSLLSLTGDVHVVFFTAADREQCLQLLRSKWPGLDGAAASAAALANVQLLHESFSR